MGQGEKPVPDIDRIEDRPGGQIVNNGGAETEDEGDSDERTLRMGLAGSGQQVNPAKQTAVRSRSAIGIL